MSSRLTRLQAAFARGVAGIVADAGTAATHASPAARYSGAVFGNRDKRDHVRYPTSDRPAGRTVRPSDAVGVRSRALPPRLLTVARLVASGLTNREIGVQLSLSTGTVANYNVRIRERLGLARRGEIAAWVARLPAERSRRKP
jgi:DNA-binding NarL/FixJ family response regulator